MREILFRAWDKNEKLMYDAIVIQRNEFVGVPVVGGDGWELSKRKMQDVELMQSTGLKDKNGILIYEGDIVKRPLGTFYSHFCSVCKKTIDENPEPMNDVIVFNEGAFKGDYDVNKSTGVSNVSRIYSAYPLDKCEIIGNIYENPSLLKV